MRKYLVTAAFLFTTILSFAQSKDHRLGITLGGGPQDYKGDLGNGFGISSYDVWRGAVVFNAGYYINRSFDVGVFGTFGDYGLCQSYDVANTAVPDEDRCPGCEDRVGLGNLSAHIDAGGLMIKYKFANGYIMREKSRLRPYVYAGTAFNVVSDPMKMNCVRTGNYMSVNAGLGARFYISERLSVGYNLGFGYFTRDDVDFMWHGGTNDMYMQNSLSLGIDLF